MKNRSILQSCSCCFIIAALLGGSCGIAGFFLLQQPTGTVTFWGLLISAGQYDPTELVVCEGSQADQYTLEFEGDDSTFSQFTVTREAEQIVGTGTLQRDGETSQWKGIFT